MFAIKFKSLGLFAVSKDQNFSIFSKCFRVRNASFDLQASHAVHPFPKAASFSKPLRFDLTFICLSRLTA